MRCPVSGRGGMHSILGRGEVHTILWQGKIRPLLRRMSGRPQMVIARVCRRRPFPSVTLTRMRSASCQFVAGNTTVGAFVHLHHHRRGIPRIHALPPSLVMLLQPLTTRSLSLIKQLQVLKLPALLAEPLLCIPPIHILALQMLHTHTIPLVILFQKAQPLPASLHLTHRIQRHNLMTTRRHSHRKPLHDRLHQLLPRQ